MNTPTFNLTNTCEPKRRSRNNPVYTTNETDYTYTPNTQQPETSSH